MRLRNPIILHKDTISIFNSTTGLKGQINTIRKFREMLNSSI